MAFEYVTVRLVTYKGNELCVVIAIFGLFSKCMYM